MDDKLSNGSGRALSGPRVVDAMILNASPSGVEGEIETLLSMTVRTAQPSVELFEMSVRVFKAGGKPDGAELKKLLSVTAPMAVGWDVPHAHMRDVQFIKFGSQRVGPARSFELLWPNFRVVATPCKPPEEISW